MIEDGDLDARDFEKRAGDDSPPLFSYVRDEPYKRGVLTSTARTASASYQRFLGRHKEVRDGRRE